MGITLGPMMTFRLINKLNIDLKLEVGRAFTIEVVDELADSDSFGKGFALDLCTTLRYNIYKRWSLLTEAGYFATSQKFPHNHRVKMQKIYLGFGAVYTLGKKIQ
jgi:hypothetical protein